MIKAILTKPLDGMPEGTEREFAQADFDRLKKLGAVRKATAGDSAIKRASPPSNKKAPAVTNKSV
ncbi:hypothetical protein D5400_16995 [Georhizobium profundi]|uniref:Uncharacterized protein n=1 Tax=Georhizobium profundi TaxID=2341112 RepID=A0A3Q8XSG8_9HYPH|nr:hypothetical protein [Georhizobium profundi]AZN72747.1 hypothetical protein D5400_16995 [Georhizobium profundi]